MKDNSDEKSYCRWIIRLKTQEKWRVICEFTNKNVCDSIRLFTMHTVHVVMALGSLDALYVSTELNHSHQLLSGWFSWSRSNLPVSRG